MTRLAVNAAIVLMILVGVAVLWKLREVVVLFLVSLALAAAVRPGINALTRSGLPRMLGVVGTYVLGLGALGALGFVTVTLLVGDLERLAGDAAGVYRDVTEQWSQGGWLQQMAARWALPPQELFAALTGQRGAALLQSVLGKAFSMFNTALNGIVILVLSIYWTTGEGHFERLWLSLVPIQQRQAARRIWRTIESEVGAYFRSEFVQSLLAGVALGLGYSLVGFRYPTLLAVIAALVWLLPWVGIVAAVVALALLSAPALMLEEYPGAAITTGVSLGYTLLVLLFLQMKVEPRFFNRGRYNSLLTVLAVIALADNFGILGLLLGPPLAVAIQVLGESMLRARVAAASGPVTESPQGLADRMEVLRAAMGELGSPPPELVALMERLAGLVSQSQDVMSVEDRPCPPGGPAGSGPP